MWLKWFPWRYAVSRAARARGFIDPITVLSRLHRFSEPSEVAVPLELLRAGVAFHSRGLMNTQAIQHNLDWVWPIGSNGSSILRITLSSREPSPSRM